MTGKTVAASAALDDPLKLAELYRAGLGRHWNSLREGSKQLSALNIKVSAARIQQAIAIAEFPREILDLFRQTGLVNRTARELIRARNTQGLDALRVRAITIDSTGKSRTQLLALLCGDEVVGSSYRVHSKERPLVLDQRYREGRASGLWSSVREAARVLEIDQPRLARATQIAALPEEVKALFPGQALTFALGWQLIQLTKLRGTKVMRRVAVAARSCVPALSQQEMMKRFVGLEGDSVDVKIKHGEKGKLVIEFHCDVNDPGAETRLAMMAMWLRNANSSDQ